MEAPLHHSPVPLPAAPATIMAPPRQHDAIGAAVLQQQQVAAVMARKPAPGPTVVTGREQCPRCASRDTKFCYYNNYNTAQPRHFCRACRRYWTLGGSLRNVPVGGSTRKRPRPARLSRAAASSAGTTIATLRCPLFASSPAVTAPGPTATARSGLLNSLLPGSAVAPLLPVLEGRVGFNLGLEQPAGSTGAGDLLAQLGCGAVPLPWVPTTTVLEGDRAQTTWKSSGGAFPPASALWKELAAAMQPAGAGGLHHGATTPLLL